MEDLITSRRSVRTYEKKTIPKDLIEKLLRAAMSAPSAMNSQPWHFVVIDKREMLDQIPSFSIYAKMCKEAPLAILVCAEPELAYGDYWIQDCSAATENILLAAHSMGLGAVWTGVFPKKEKVDGFKKLLKLPPSIEPFSLVPIGYPKDPGKKKDKFKKDRIHINSW